MNVYDMIQIGLGSFNTSQHNGQEICRSAMILDEFESMTDLSATFALIKPCAITVFETNSRRIIIHDSTNE